MGGFAWVTLATNDSYSLGALVLAHSLRRAGTIHQLAVLVTPGVTPSMREKLGSVFDSVVEVNVLDSQDAANLALLARPDLGITFTKLHCWRLTQYDKCCFLDADTLVIQNVDELSEREELSAAPDVGWPDCFNSGVFVFKPSNETFNSLMSFALQFGSFDGGDQGLLNLYFKDWAHKDITRHLPFIYNMSSSATYSYLPAFKQFGTQVKVIHFLGTSKPWLCYLDSQSKVVQVPGEFNHIKGLLQFWWDIFCQDVHPSLTPSMRVDSSFFEVPHTHPAHQEMNPALPTHHIPSMLFIDPWDDYVERLRTETQQQKQKDGWLEIVSHDQRQRGCDDQTPENTLDNDVHGHERNTSGNDVHIHERDKPENDVHSHKRDISEWSDTGHDNREEPLSHSLPSNPHSSESFPFNSRSDPSSSTPLANNVSGDHGMDGHNEHTNSAGLAGAFSQLTLGEPRSAEQTALEDHLRRQSWEQGHIDYMGRDSFDNIWNKILKTLGGPVSAPSATSEPSPAPAVASAPSVPEPSSAPVAVPEPSPASAAVPEPSPVSAAVPEPAPAPIAVPEPVPAPVAVPEPAPAPVAVPEPASAPVVVPEPAPAPVAVPEPAPAPVAVPEPSPAPVVVPEPSPASAPVPAVTAAPASAPAAVPVPAAAPAPSPVSVAPPPASVAPAPAAAAPLAPAPAATAPSPDVAAAPSPAPPTPTVTTATPPTSPPIASPPQPQPSPEALKVDPTPPGTPPVAPGSSDPLEPTASAPVPPKRKGSGSTKGKK